MKRYSKIILLTTILTIAFTMFMPFTKVHAVASASLKATKNTIFVGESTQIVASVSESEVWNLKVTSDGGNLSGETQDAGTPGKEVSKQVISCNFSASSAGTYTISLSGTVANAADVSAKNPPTDASTSIKITVKDKESSPNTSSGNDNIPQESNPGSTPNTTAKSSNNYLSSLKVSEGTLSPEFNFRTYQYTVNVGKEVESIKVTASAEHNKAKVSGTGTKTLKPGENKINVTVKAEDGKSRTYTIVVNKPTEEEPQEVKVMLKSLVVKGVIETEEGEETLELPFTPDFASDVFEYEILLDEALEDIIRLDIEAIGEQEDYTIDISGNEEITEGENIVTITVKSKDGQNVATYKILVTKPEKVMPISASVVDNEQQENPPLWNTTQKIFITVFTAITAILGIIFGVIEYRHSKKKGENKTAEIPFSKIEEKPKEDKTETLQEFFNADKEEKKEKKERKSKEEKVDKKESTIDKFDKEEKPTRGKGKHF